MRDKRYLLELGAAFSLYLALLAGAIALEATLQPEGTLKFAITMAPMLGALAMAFTIFRALQRMDELQRRIQFDAFAMAFLGTALITLGWGFAETAGCIRLPTFAVWPIMAALWGFGTFVAGRRYR